MLKISDAISLSFMTGCPLAIRVHFSWATWCNSLHPSSPAIPFGH